MEQRRAVYCRSNFARMAVVLMVGMVMGCLQQVPITTDPRGATVIVDGAAIGSSPATAEFDRHIDHVVMIQMDGYRRERVDIRSVSRTSHTSHAGPNGAMSTTSSTQYWLEPQSIHVRLEPRAPETQSVTSVQSARSAGVPSGALDRASLSEITSPVAGRSPLAVVEQWYAASSITREERRVLRRLVTVVERSLRQPALPPPVDQNESSPIDDSDATSERYFVHIRGEDLGPLNYRQVAEWLIRGRITLRTPVRIGDNAAYAPLIEQMMAQP